MFRCIEPSQLTFHGEEGKKKPPLPSSMQMKTFSTPPFLVPNLACHANHAKQISFFFSLSLSLSRLIAVLSPLLFSDQDGFFSSRISFPFVLWMSPPAFLPSSAKDLPRKGDREKDFMTRECLAQGFPVLLQYAYTTSAATQEHLRAYH